MARLFLQHLANYLQQLKFAHQHEKLPKQVNIVAQY